MESDNPDDLPDLSRHQGPSSEDQDDLEDLPDIPSNSGRQADEEQPDPNLQLVEEHPTQRVRGKI